MKILLLCLMVITPLQTFAADSVYSWGNWEEGIKPAAGPVIQNIQAVQTPSYKTGFQLRANETHELKRSNSEAAKMIRARINKEARQIAGNAKHLAEAEEAAQLADQAKELAKREAAAQLAAQAKELAEIQAAELEVQ